MSALCPRLVFLLDEACRPIREAFDATPYLVGTAAEFERTAYGDVDVRLIMFDEEYDKLRAAVGMNGIAFLGFAIGEYLAARTGLPIDFQLQRMTEANAKHGGKRRNPLGMRELGDFKGDAFPKEDPTCSTP